MSTETENHMCLRYEAIYNAVMGDRDAIEEVLKYYGAYITSLWIGYTKLYRKDKVVVFS